MRKITEELSQKIFNVNSCARNGYLLPAEREEVTEVVRLGGKMMRLALLKHLTGDK